MCFTDSVNLFFQASRLETETISYEEKEQQLVNDCVKELRECLSLLDEFIVFLLLATPDGLSAAFAFRSPPAVISR